MTTTDVTTWLQEGIAAAKAGEQAKARGLLQKVVEADESNYRRGCGSAASWRR
ncbi:MAG: hypothetical protein U0559_04820 [Anaerolineae bacterium]